jgi:nucleoside phosphorylase
VRDGGLAALERAQQTIADWHPDAVLAVGVAFGVDRKRQAYGDVLVASQVEGYERQRVNKGGRVTLREPRLDAPERWLQRARQTIARGQRTGGPWPTARVGLVLSGQKLIDDRAFRDGVIALTGGEAVGGEMEAHGLLRACQSARTDWLVIKAIADFADGKKPKGEEKQRIQRDAAFRAAWVARWTIAGGVPEPLPIYGDPRRCRHRRAWPENGPRGRALAGGGDARLRRHARTRSRARKPG